MQWNALSLKTNKNTFIQHVKENKPDIIMLQSIGKNKKYLQLLPKLEGYYYPPRVGMEQGTDRCRTATYIHNSLAILDPPKLEIGLDHNAITTKIKTKDGVLNIANCYYPEGVRKNLPTWLVNIDGGESWLVAGDFNAHHETWDPRFKGPSKDQALLDLLEESNLHILNTGDATFHTTRNTKMVETTPDLTLCSTNLATKCEWEVLEDDLGSDHFPIYTKITLGTARIQRYKEPKYIYKKANWGRFSRLCEEAAWPGPDTPEETIEDQYKTIKTIISTAADRSIPKSGNVVRDKKVASVWTNECEQARKDKLKKLKIAKKEQDPEIRAEKYMLYKRAKARARFVVANADRLAREEYLENEVHEPKDESKVWTMIDRERHPGITRSRPLIHNSTKYETNEEKAEIFADTFAKASQHAQLPDNMKTHRESNNPEKDIPLGPDRELATDTPFTMTELKRAIKSIKRKDKATGMDGIGYPLIAALGEQGQTKLLAFYNKCYTEGQTPQEWREAIVIPIHKKGKPKNDPNSYRPISLTPHLGKVYERLVRARLEYTIERNQTIPKIQAGFRRGRSCTDQTVLLTNFIKRQILRRKWSQVVCFDVKKAYDSVWLQKLLAKLRQIGIKGNMHRAISSMILGRSMRVRVEGSISSKRQLDIGLPQGSILAPTLFNIMIHDIDKIGLKHCQMGIYADDIALWYSGTTTNKITKNHFTNIQSDIDKLLKYMWENGFQLAPEKTETMLIPPKTYTDTRVNEILKGIRVNYIQVNGVKIPRQKKIKYLGTWIDINLNFTHHINTAISKANKAIIPIRLLMGLPGGISTQTLLNVARATVRSRLIYGSECYHSASFENIRKMEKVECKTLRLILGISRTTSKKVTYRMAGWRPLANEVALAAAKYRTRADALDAPTKDAIQKDDILENWYAQSKKITKKIECCINLGNHSEYIKKEAGVDKITPVAQNTQSEPPWESKDVKTDLDYGGYTKTNHPHVLASMAMEKIGKQDIGYSAYTDGSRKGDKVGFGWIDNKGNKKSERIEDALPIATAETAAILSVTDHIVNSITQDKNIHIMTDSKSAIQAIESSKPQRKDIVDKIKTNISKIISRGQNITLVWIPSHSGIKLNDEADILAKEGANKNQVSYNVGYSVPDINSRLTQHMDTKWKEEYDYEQQLKGDDWPKANDGPLLPKIPARRHELALYRRFVIGRGNLEGMSFPNQCECGVDLTIKHTNECSLYKNIEPDKFKNLKRDKNKTTVGLFRDRDVDVHLKLEYVRALFRSGLHLGL